MANMMRATQACVPCWCYLLKYFMLKQCLENVDEGLLQARISSLQLNMHI